MTFCRDPHIMTIHASSEGLRVPSRGNQSSIETVISIKRGQRRRLDYVILINQANHFQLVKSVIYGV